jgi:iron complex transport system ATP-binding protein
LKPVSGSVELDGVDAVSLPAKKFAASVAYVPQSLDAGQDMTVSELVSLGRNPHQAWWNFNSSNRDRTIVDAALEKAELADLKTRYLSNLSGGERQRASIAMALAQEPKYLLMDEPSSFLDFRHQQTLVDLLRQMKEHNIGIAIVLHDLNLIAALADSVLLLQANAGGASTVCAHGDVQAVLTPALLRQAFAAEIHVLSDPSSKRKAYLHV